MSDVLREVVLIAATMAMGLMAGVRYLWQCDHAGAAAYGRQDLRGGVPID
jgi:hypothetical protein